MKFLALPAVLLAMGLPTVPRPELTTLGIGFICGAEQRPAVSATKQLVIQKGVGTGGFKVDTASPEAQQWFDYGMQLYHAFYHAESRDAFAKAVELDPNCALCGWGKALSLGANLNFGATPAVTAQALTEVERAEKLVQPGDEKSRLLLAALKDRYQPGGSREKAFGEAMDAIALRYPADTDIADLAAQAFMIEGRGANKENVARGNAILERVLAKNPSDTAAIHYYIHGSEFAGEAYKALPYAQRLASLSPNASHLVHMAAHTMIHVGLYEDVALVNAQAMQVDGAFTAANGQQAAIGEPQYYLHNYVFGLTGAMLAGDAPLAMKYADHADKAYPAPAARRPAALQRAYMAYGRYAPDKALALPEPAKDQFALAVMRHYARGEALTARNDAKGVRGEAQALKAMVIPAEQTGTKNLADIARNVLEGRAAMLENHPAEAVTAYAAAVKIQDDAFAKSWDPPPWWYPVRRSLAAAYLKAGRYAEAKAQVEQSLVLWPKDALALRMLSEAETKLGQRKAAREHMKEANAAWRGKLKSVPISLI